MNINNDSSNITGSAVQCQYYYNYKPVENDIVSAFNCLGFKDKVKVMNYILRLLKKSLDK